ncbi:leucine-rich repeat protein [Capnocytophaga sp.]|uniref:leucine-rich repeat protein n=1 Tax=Capnocytophaga sp. TaxID=44737 RepID=UPI0026DB42DD|nr:leucine-rich repeat protein [Capnocytophaga sp.]MDO5106101.1 leucine-rich repeat protein [Capnocytophaga sp.]
MRKIAMYAIALLLAMGTVSCTKEGPAGKDGIDGKDGRDGKDGKNGNVIITGNGAPDAGLGNVGDYYFDRTTSNLYGAKTAQGWGTPVSLKGLQGEKGDTGNTGADGNKILYGTTAPSANLGNIGDWYIDTQNGRLYGAKTAQGWGNGVSLNNGGGQVAPKFDFIISRDGTMLTHWFNQGVTSINMNDYPELKDVTQIGTNVFSDFHKLSQVVLTDKITHIEKGAFYSCIKLTQINIPQGITYIGKSAFENTGLASVVLPNGITRIEKSTFAGCSSLNAVHIPNSVTYTGDYAFIHSGLTSIVIPNSVTELGGGAFYGCEKLTSVTLSNQMTIIKGGDYSGTFSNCPMLTTLTIPASITTIEKGAFQNSGLTTVTLEATTPPQMENYRGLFFNQYVDTHNNTLTGVKIVYVPASSLNAYQAAAGWSELQTKGISLQAKP